MGELHGVIAKSGTWYSYGDMRLGQGKENVREFLKNNQELTFEIETKVREKLGLNKSGEASEDVEDKS